LLPRNTSDAQSWSIWSIGTFKTSANLFKDVAASSAEIFVAIPNQAAVSVNLSKFALHLTHN